MRIDLDVFVRQLVNERFVVEKTLKLQSTMLAGMRAPPAALVGTRAPSRRS